MTTKTACALLSACLILGGMFRNPARGSDWPGWRGARRDGVSDETGLLARWPRRGPPLKWTVKTAGKGYSSFAVKSGTLYTMGNRGSREFVIAYDAATGEERWATPTGRGFKQGRGDGPRGTPTVDDDSVYAEGAEGELVCLDAKEGRRRWGFNILERFGGRNIGWGLSESPLVAGDLVIVCPGAREASVVALRKDSGDVVWKSAGERPGYASPILIEDARPPQVVVFNSRAGVGIDLARGKRLWSYARAANGTANCTTPIYHDEHVFFTSDYGTGGGLVRLTSSPNGGVEAEEVYFNRNMKNHHGGVVLVDGYLYGFSSNILTCIDFKSGERAWRDRSVGKGSLVYADGHLYCLSENGVVGLVRATPEGYHEKSRFSIGRGENPTWAHPVVAGGHLFLRRDGNILCFDVGAGKRES